MNVFKRDPREGCAHAFYDFLIGIQDGQDFRDKIRPDSEKSGAAMRAAPIGVCPSEDDVVERSNLQASITHDTDLGKSTAVAMAR